MLLRLLFPSWAFFDAVTDVPLLEVRTWTPSGAPTVWMAATVAPRRGWRHILFNPEGNEHLAVQAVVDRFAVECETGIHDDVTRALVEQIAARAVRGACAVREENPPVMPRWQWRIGARPAGSSDTGAYRALFESAVQSWAGAPAP